MLLRYCRKTNNSTFEKNFINFVTLNKYKNKDKKNKNKDVK